MGAREARLIACASGFGWYSARLKCKAFVGVRNCVQVHACVHVLLSWVLGSVFHCQISSLLSGTCNNRGAIRHWLSDETKLFSLKRHLVTTRGFELMDSKRQRLVFVWGGLSDSYFSVSLCKTEEKICRSNKQRLKVSQGLMAMSGRQVCSRVSVFLCWKG